MLRPPPFFGWSLFHLDEGGLNISGSGGVAAPTRPLNLCFGWRGGAMFFGKLQLIVINSSTGFVYRSYITSFSFTVDSSCVFSQGRNIYAMICNDYIHRGRNIETTNSGNVFAASCYQVLRMLSNQTRDVKSRHDSFPLRAKVDETGQLLVLT